MKCIVDASLGNLLRVDQKVSRKKRKKLLSLDGISYLFSRLIQSCNYYVDLILAQLEVLRNTGRRMDKINGWIRLKHFLVALYVSNTYNNWYDDNKNLKQIQFDM